MQDAALYQALGAVLNDYRTSRGLYLSDLTACTGLTVGALSLIELGKTRCHLHILIRLADFYGVPASELLSAAQIRLLASQDACAAAARS